jgi:hypothetical protein
LNETKKVESFDKYYKDNFEGRWEMFELRRGWKICRYLGMNEGVEV